MIFGIITAVCIVLLASKFITKRLALIRIDKIMSKLHKVLGVLTVGLVIVHFGMTLPLFDTRPIGIYILGVLDLVCMIVIVCSYLLRSKLGKRWLTIHRIGTVCIIVITIIHILLVNNSLISYQKAMNQISFQTIEVSDVKDGVYEGEYDVGYIYAKVRVTVHSGKIEDILILEHENERGKKAESTLDIMVKEQKTEVDAVTGATNSSKVLRKAVENALLLGTNK
jgi:uncharacterized protein with FMN-binding domain